MSELPGGDDIIEAYAQAFDALLIPGRGDVLRDAWRDIKTWLLPPLCDCPMDPYHDPYHRWNCPLTPLWAQTIRDLDVNPWTVMKASTE